MASCMFATRACDCKNNQKLLSRNSMDSKLAGSVFWCDKAVAVSYRNMITCHVLNPGPGDVGICFGMHVFVFVCVCVSVFSV